MKSSPIIRDDSPLRRLPGQLKRKQTLFLDGIRVAAEVMDSAYSRLSETLLDLSGRDSAIHLACRDSASAVREGAIITAVQDAWTIVDSVHRLRCLLRRMPGVKQKAPGRQTFYRATSTIEALRNAVQHLDSEIDNLVKLGVPLWGTIQWLVLVDPATRLVRSCTIVAGTIFGAIHPVQTPIGKRMRGTVDQVILTAGGTSVNLSDVVFEVGKMVEGLERSLEQQFGNLPKHGSDMLIMVDMEPATDQA